MNNLDLSFESYWIESKYWVFVPSEKEGLKLFSTDRQKPLTMVKERPENFWAPQFNERFAFPGKMSHAKAAPCTPIKTSEKYIKIILPCHEYHMQQSLPLFAVFPQLFALFAQVCSTPHCFHFIAEGGIWCFLQHVPSCLQKASRSSPSSPELFVVDLVALLEFEYGGNSLGHTKSDKCRHLSWIVI